MKQRFIRINVSLAGYDRGQQWPYDKAPDVIKMWLKRKAILFETKICSLVEVEVAAEPKNKTAAQINQDNINKLLGDEHEKAKKKPKVVKPKKPKATKKGKSKKKTGRPKGSKNKKR